MKKFVYFALLSSIIFSNQLISCVKKEDDQSVAKSKVFKIDSLKKDLNTYRVCIERLPKISKSISEAFSDSFPIISNVQAYVSDTNIISDGIRIDTMIQNLNVSPYLVHGPSTARVAIIDPYKWRKKVLNVQFLDGDLAVINKVIEVAKTWEKYCSIRFNFSQNLDPDISISFKYSGSWSDIGSFSKNNRPSMNLGWLTVDTPNEEYNRVVLHEFGHALGFIHEHQNPNNNPIEWNEPEVYRIYSSFPNNWKIKEIYENIILRYDHKSINGTAFDPKSIMIYGIEKELTSNNFSVDWNTKLSENDILFVKKAYP
ncbi:M12 family metallopeptidase [Larkinella terrae]|uniref:Peptidase metallopeptidase domain-containing protein n=1 Tax=Larkinella terrae TaxID=2025311 RepID=A0A7K0EGE4_9BACT|nr:M12 family metallopeptidase [Larkinella terrae]MRS60920.1 hypothetical protein [Larkinella terrae]